MVTDLPVGQAVADFAVKWVVTGLPSDRQSLISPSLVRPTGPSPIGIGPGPDRRAVADFPIKWVITDYPVKAVAGFPVKVIADFPDH